jgi:hypothetical protein
LALGESARLGTGERKGKGNVNAGKFETAVELSWVGALWVYLSWAVVVENPFFFSGRLVYRLVGMIRPIVYCFRSWRVVFFARIW